jgi:RHS repeat-associated protein
MGQAIAFDDDGQVASVTDAAGRTTRFLETEPDAQGRRRRIRVLADGSRVTEELDRFGRRLSLADDAGTATFRYDGFSRLTAVRREGLPELKFTRNASGQVKSIELGAGLACSYRHDFLGRLVGIDSPAGAIAVERKLAGDGRMEVAWRYPNGVRTVQRYADGRLESIRHTGPGDKELAQFAYAYRPDGLVSEARERWPDGEVVRRYLYDNVQRLATVIDSRRGTTSYRYDAVGNRLEVVSSDGAVASRFDWAGRLVAHAGQACSHDAAGSLTRWQGTEGVVRCVYSADNALASVQRGGARVDFLYDGDGRLARRTAAGGRTDYVVDPRSDVWRPLLAQEPDGRKTLFVWAGERPVAASGGGGAEFYLTDRLGSVRLVADRAGNVRRLDYDPFGMPYGESTGHELRHGFGGMFYDPETALYLTTARAYAPELGRFLQIDPIHRVPRGSQKDLSAYAYCGNDPVNFRDANGAWPDPAADPAASTLDSMLNDLRDAAARRRPSMGDRLFDALLNPRPPDYVLGYDWSLRSLWPANEIYGYWGGGTRAPAERAYIDQLGAATGENLVPLDESRFDDYRRRWSLPDPVDSVDSAYFRHDLRLRRLRQQRNNPDLGATSADPDVVTIHTQLVVELEDALRRGGLSGRAVMAAREARAFFTLLIGALESAIAARALGDAVSSLSDDASLDSGLPLYSDPGSDAGSARIVYDESADGGRSLAPLDTRTATTPDSGPLLPLLRSMAGVRPRPLATPSDGGPLLPLLRSLTPVPTSPSTPSSDPTASGSDDSSRLVMKDTPKWGDGSDDRKSIIYVEKNKTKTGIDKGDNKIVPYTAPVSGDKGKGKGKADQFGGYNMNPFTVRWYDRTTTTVDVRRGMTRGVTSSGRGAGFATRSLVTTGGSARTAPARSAPTGVAARSAPSARPAARGFAAAPAPARGGAPSRARILYNDRVRRSSAPASFRPASTSTGGSARRPANYNSTAGGLRRSPTTSGVAPSYFRTSYAGGGRAAAPMRPRPVGGVRLAGAGDALRGLGELRGVALDAAGRLVLLGGGDQTVGLPPLRLDDVVTVFRCVYQKGEAPFVSIDPDPADPDWKIHAVRHDKFTRDTYVGWVLFEADRVMKCYAAGMDNLTGKPFRSRVAGYRDDIDRGFDFWGEEKGKHSQHRNWIVPAGTVRRQNGAGQLTLLEVPLMVRTERTMVRDGKIVDAPDLGRTQSAIAFVEWFTKHYRDIDAEWTSQPPPESGITGPVHVFAELQRIATLSAVAESLQARGVPMPAWMRDYPVRPCPTPRTTPGAHRQEKRNSDGEVRTITIRGGVQLAPPSDAVKTVANAPEAQSLAPVLTRAVEAAPTLKPIVVEHGGQRYQAVALPGGDSSELGGLHLEEVDLAVPIAGGEWLSLPRSYDSFFDPAGALGRGWTLDLPRIETFRRTVSRDIKGHQTTAAWRLTSPLGSDTDFSQLREVPEVKTQLAVPDRPGAMLGLTGFGPDARKRIDVPTQKLLWRDGRRWHFDREGRPRAEEQAPFLRVYHYDGQGRLDKVEGWYGGEKASRATLLLKYDEQGRLMELRGQTGDAPREDDPVARYSYEGDRLHGVKVGATTMEYRWTPDGLLSAEVSGGEEVRAYEYAPGGRLLAERGDGARIDYRVVRDAAGARVAALGDGETLDEARYDAAGRLVGCTLPDGTAVACTYDEAGALRATLTAPGLPAAVLTRSADGRREQVRLPTGGELAADYDAAGRTTDVTVGGDKVLQVAYRPDGLVESVANDRYLVRPQYREGIACGVRIDPGPGTDPAGRKYGIDLDDKGRTSKVWAPDGQWAEARYDDKGRLEAVKSARGEVKVRYDNKGRPQSVVSPRGETKVRYDDQGRVAAVEAPGGLRREGTFDPDSGRLRRLKVSRGGASEEVELDGGLPVAARRFDLGETRYDYEEVEGGGRRLRRIQAANGLELTYEYDAQGRLAAVNCGSAYRLEYGHDEAGRLVRWTMVPPRGNRGLWR